MSETFTGPDSAQERGPTSVTPLTRQKIRSPHQIPFQSVSSLVEQWADVCSRISLAKHPDTVALDCDDLFAEDSMSLTAPG